VTEAEPEAVRLELGGEYWLSARGVLRLVELTDPSAVTAGPAREWLVDFQRRRSAMSEAEAMREVLTRIGCGHLMPKPKAVDGRLRGDE
jgi:hypothetical protein